MDIFTNGTRSEAPVAVKSGSENSSKATLSSQDEPNVAKELKVRPFREYFQIFGDNPEADTKVAYVLRQLDPTGELKDDELIQKLNKLNTKIGEGNLGEGKLHKIYRWLRSIEVMSAALKEWV